MNPPAHAGGYGARAELAYRSIDNWLARAYGLGMLIKPLSSVSARLGTGLCRSVLSWSMLATRLKVAHLKARSAKPRMGGATFSPVGQAAKGIRRLYWLLGCVGWALGWLTVGPVESRAQQSGGALPVRGLHLAAPSSKKDLPTALEFIRTVLPQEGVNTLILEFNYQFDYRSRPEFAEPSALGPEEARQLVQACRAAGIELIPQINCLGHQSWGQRNGRLLQRHPEFDETPGKYPDNKGIYCRSYCPRHPQVHAVLFDLIDELVRASDARSFHVGMDEVFILGDADCPRCRGSSPAELFGEEVQRLQAHLKQRGCRMWMWGDRFLDGKATGIGKWEASENGTHPALYKVPKDIVICDWHYEKAHPTPQFFATNGFAVVACPWRHAAVATGQLAHIRGLRAHPDPAVAGRALGMVQTTWCGFVPFVRAYKAVSDDPTAKGQAAEAARCFKTLFAAIRAER
jgi:hypothetical protein